MDNYPKPVDKTVPSSRGQVPSEQLSPRVRGQEGTVSPKPPLTCGYTCPLASGDSRGQGVAATCPLCPPPYRGTGGGQPTGQPYVFPFPDAFWQRASVRALAPIPWYIGPIPNNHEMARSIAPVEDREAFVYVLISDLLEVLYVGKTINLADRFVGHRFTKPWWPTSGRLVLLMVDGVDRADAEAAALFLERLVIRDLNPLYNIAGVKR